MNNDWTNGESNNVGFCFFLSMVTSMPPSAEYSVTDAQKPRSENHTVLAHILLLLYIHCFEVGPEEGH